MVANLPGLRWAVGRHRIRAYVNQNHPVVIDTSGEIADRHPMEAVGNVVWKYLGGEVGVGSRPLSTVDGGVTGGQA